jgi:hypothetical protein
MEADEMGKLFTTVAQGIDPDLATLTGPAIRRGRRMRRRRRALLSAVSAASAVAVTAGVIAGIQVVPAPARGSNRPAQGSRPVVAVHKPHKAVRQAHGPGMTRAQMVAVLRRLLPPGAVLTSVVPISRGEIEVNYNDGHGPVDLSVTANLSTRLHPALTVLMFRHCQYPLPRDEGPRPAGAPLISCINRTLPDGTLERVSVTGSDRWGLYDYIVMEYRPDGIEVGITIGNATLPVSAASHPRQRPPGSLAEWAAIARSPAWHL